MTTSELATAVVARNKAKFSNADYRRTKSLIEDVFAIIADGLQHGDKVKIVGFGVFDVKNRAARTGRNPRTGEEIKLPLTRRVYFTPGTSLKIKSAE